MRTWKPRRGSTYVDDFDTQVRALGFDTWLWDNAAPLFEEVLCGADRERLDLVFPPNARGLRLLLTERTRGLPPLRIAFRLDEAASGEETIVYVAVSPRRT